MERIQMPFGYIETSGLNDVTIISTTGDPVNVKFAAPEGISLGAITWGILRPDGNIESKVLFQGKVNETQRFNPDIKERGGEFTIHCHDGQKHYVNGEIRDDASMKLVLMARHDMVWVNNIVTKMNYPDGLPGWQGPLPSNPAPSVPPVPPTLPLPKENYYRGFKEGDFPKLETYFGYSSDDRENYLQNKMTWIQVVDEMFRRNLPSDTKS